MKDAINTHSEVVSNSFNLDNIEIYKTLFTNNSNAIFILDANLNIYKVNKAFTMLTGYKEDITLKELMADDHIQSAQSHIERVLKGEIQIFETIATSRDSQKIHMNMTLIPIPKNMEIIGVFAVAVDVTEVKQQQRELLKMEESLHLAQTHTDKQLKENEKQFRNIYNNLEVGIWSYDPNKHKILFCSNGMEKISGYSAKSFEENADLWFSLIHPDDDLRFEKYKEVLLGGKYVQGQYRIIHSSGETRWVMKQSLPVFDAHQNLIRVDGIISDITDQKKAEEQINHLANHDYLTNLLNRMVFDKYLTDHLKNCKKNIKKFAILYLDIDRFKKINDTLGHNVGDELIKQISSRLKDVVTDGRLFRMGGDEFAMILPSIEEDHYPLKIAEKINNMLKPSFDIKGYELYITMSIGISIYPESGDDQEGLLKSATAALARAKQMGENNIQVCTCITCNKSSYYLEKEMRKSLGSKQFEVYYQPRVCAQTGMLLSAEALIRWNHPEWGMVSPIEFIPLAEESELIHEIDQLVITTVCQQLKKWQQDNLTVVPISVNISAKSFYRNDLVSNLTSIFQKANVNAGLLELEITESSFLDNVDKVTEVLDELRQFGIKIALDDFGTGYSSLTHLKALNIDTIKIDRSFIQNITTSKQEETITSCIIQLAHGLNMDVVAEGVETTAQLELLQQKGCNQIQGFLYSKPIPEKEFRSILRDKKV